MANTKVTTNVIANSAITVDHLHSSLDLSSKTLSATTQSASDNTTKVATTAYVTTAIDNLIDSAPGTMNTLNEIAAAINDDANFNTTVTNLIAGKLPLAGGTMTGNLDINGNQLILDADADTSFREASDDYIIMKVGGTDLLKIDSSGLGIGIRPAEMLDIQSASGDARIRLDAPSGSDTEIKFFNDASAQYTIGHDDGTDNFVIGGANVDTPLMSITKAGKVGIGATSLSYGLEIDGADFSGDSLRISRGTSEFYVLNANNSYGVLGMKSNDDLQIRTNATTRMTILGDGSTGIGTTTPKATLDIKPDNNSWEGGILIQHDNANTGWNIHPERTGSSLWFGYNSNTSLSLANQGATEVMHLMATGKVGIGTNDPTVPLDVYNGSGWGGVDIDGTSGGELRLLKAGTMYGNLYASNSHGLVINAANGLGDIILSSGGTSIMTLLDSGEVGIGVTPDTLSSGYSGLQINGYAYLIGHSGGDHYITNNAYFNSGWKYGKTSTAQKVELASGRITLMTAASGSADAAITWNTGLVQASDGRIGINEVSPDTLLHIDGNSASSNTDVLSVSNKGVTTIGHTAGMRFQYNTAVPAAIRANLTNTSSGAGELGFYTSPDGTAGNLDKRLTILTTETSRAVTQSLGGHSVGDGNTGDVHKPGVRVLGWYNANASNSSNSYLHLVTSLWGGGSPHGNSQYIMGGWEITGHSYSTNASFGKCGVFFHNWSGSVAPGYSINYTGSFTNFAHVYVNSSGYVTVRLAAAAYRGYWLDLYQAGHYTTRDINVTAATFSSSSTL